MSTTLIQRKAVCGWLLLTGMAACDPGPSATGADSADAMLAADATPTRSASSDTSGSDAAPPAHSAMDGGAGTGAGDAASPPKVPTDAAAMVPSDGATSQDAARTDGSVNADASNNRPDSGIGSDRCDVAVYNPAEPPVALTLGGNLGTHDPALIEQEGVFYLWQTGPRVPGKTSSNLMTWQGAPSALGNANPAWIANQVPGATDLWAPDVSFFGGQYHLYYSVSTFGSNSSCIGHATRASLETGAFSDRGAVVCSNHGKRDDWNAIDPNVVVDAAGTPWLVFGSFWSGIKAVELTQSGARKDETVVHSLASRNGGAIEAPFVVRRCGYYYLFVSFDRCCDGVKSTYNIRVGRAPNVLGPYVDRDGVAMLDGGGTLVMKGAGRWHGPGHNAVIFSGARAYNVYHAYDGNNGGAPTLRVSTLAWDERGWPVSGGP